MLKEPFNVPDAASSARKAPCWHRRCAGGTLSLKDPYGRTSSRGPHREHARIPSDGCFGARPQRVRDTATRHDHFADPGQTHRRRPALTGTWM